MRGSEATPDLAMVKTGYYIVLYVGFVSLFVIVNIKKRYTDKRPTGTNLLMGQRF